VNDQHKVKWQQYAFWGLMILSMVILFTKLGSYPLQMQWEPNYGQVVREMVWGEGDAITPTCKVGSDEGAKPGTFWSKPIMIFWLAYPFYSLFGDSEWSARTPIALVGLFGIFMTVWFMSRLYNRRAGLLAGLLLITSPTYFLISRAYMVDVPFVVTMWVAIGFLLLGEKEGRAKWYYLFYAFMGLSSLAKGLTPLIIVGGNIIAYCLITMDWAIFKRMKIFKGAIIYLAVAAPWYTYMTSKYGMFYVKKFFWDHHFERALGNIDKPDDTFEMFVLYFSIGVLPWITFLPQAIMTLVPWRKNTGKEHRTELFFLAGFLFAFTFFSVISTKFPHYIFPAVPYVAMLIAIFLDRLLDDNKAGNISRLIFFFGILMLLIVAPDLLDQKNYRTLFYFITTERLQDWHPAVADPSAFFQVIFILWGVVLGVAMIWRKFNKYFIGALVVLSLAYAFYINMVMIPNLTEMFSARSMINTYMDLRKSPAEPIAEFTQTWKSRSIKYHIPFDELMNTYKYRRYRIHNNADSVKRFYQKYRNKRVFIIVEQKQKHFSRLNALWQEASGGESLIKISDDKVAGQPYRPEFWLLSNMDNSGKKTKLSKKQMQKKLKKFVLTNAVEPSVKVNAIVDNGAIEILGFDKLPEKHKAGKELTIVTYFKVNRRPPQDFKIFLHAERDPLFRLRGDHVPVSGSYPTRRWKEGEYIKDVYKLDVPPSTTSGSLDIYIGLYKGQYRAKLSDVPQRDSENRLKLATIEIVK